MRSLSAPPANTASAPSRSIVGLLVVCCITALVYTNTLGNGFVSDDRYIIEVRDERLDLGTVLQVFTSVDKLFEGQKTPYYRPLNRLTYIVERAVFGLTPRWYHAVSILLHLLCVALVSFLLGRLGCDALPSLCAALLFGIHPLNTEAVNAICARNNLLSAVFSLAAVLAFLHAEARRGHGGYLLSGFFLFLGLLSKETALMAVPFIVFLKWYREPGRPNLRAVLSWDMTFLLYPVLALSAYLFLRAFAVDNSYIQEHLPGLASRVRDLVYIIPTYLSLFFVPYPLSFHRDIPKDLLAVALPLALKWSGVVVVAVWLWRWRNRTIMIGAVWLAVNFLPISTIIPIPSASMAERYLYLPLIGACIITGDLFQRLHVRAGTKGLITLLVLIAVPFGTLTISRNRDWKDNLTLNRSIIRVDPSNWLGHFEYGYESYLRGDRATARKEFDLALQLSPHHADAHWIHYYRGTFDIASGSPEDALEHFREAVRVEPNNAAARYALATMLTGDKTGARSEYQQFLRAASISVASYHLVSEANSRVIELDRRPDGARRAPTPGRAASPGWVRYALLSSGTELSFQPSAVQVIDDRRIVTTRHLLAKSDLRSYGLMLIRYSLEHATDALFTIDLSCTTHLYKMTHMEFRDSSGKPLASYFPEREWYVLNEYIMPHTPLRSLADRVCQKGS